MSQQDSTNPAYNLQLTYHFNGKIDSEILDRSVGLLFERHYTMFSVFKHKDGIPYIEIIKRQVSVGLIDFTEISSDVRKEEIFAFTIDESRKPFDIENGPLYRLYLLKENEESYYFHATIHHLIFDGWSRRIFVQELSSIYSNLLFAVDTDLEPLTFQSCDYAEIEKGELTPEKEKSLSEFWKENLKDCPAELKLPFDNPRKGSSSGLGSRESFELSKEITTKLRGISNYADATLFNTVVSVLGILFKKYSGENDICIGIPVSNRRLHPSLEKIFGLFTNTTVARLKIDENNRFYDHVGYTRNVVRNAISNSQLPFEKIVEAVNPERISGINPLFQVSLSWMTDMTIPMNFGSVKGERITLPDGVSPFDISFYMWEYNNTIKGDIEYNADVFKRSTIIRLKDNLVHLVHTVTDYPDKRLSDISAISDHEKERIESFNNTKIAIPDCFVQDFFEQQAVIHSTKTAVICGDTRLTYKELNEKANQVARHLISLGANGGDVVGICLDRSIEMIVTVFGVLKAGCCYLPMDPTFPDDRLIYMFEDSEAKVLVTQKSLRNRFIQFADQPIVLIDADKKKINKNRIERPDLRINSQTPVYTIYTSGSTGRPKGVRVNHKSVVNLIESMSRRPGIKEDDILLAVVTLSFDMSVYELFVPLSGGATIVVAESNDTTDGSASISLIEKHNITVIQATPSFWNILLSSGWKGKKNLKALCGGEALTKNMVQQILPKVCEFWNCYGPTETTVYATCIQVTDIDSPIVIGTPIDNTTIHILDKKNNQLPIGSVGEVCIGGLGLTNGYHNRPDLTAEKFIRFEEDKVVYKTGDLGRFLDDGSIELFGRIDNQIKLRGFRIEPGEIESLLAGLPDVREAVVKINKFDDYDERLIAFLNIDSGFSMLNEEISSILSQKLPPYMIPSFYLKYDGFPRLPNGKINKNALIYEVRESGRKDKIDYDLLTATQKKLLKIWAQILMIQNISIKDDFFEIGGNSLLGIRIINKVREEFGITIVFRELITNSTIDQLSLLIDSKSERSGIIKLVHLTGTTNLPLTLNQKRIWLITKLQPGIASYIIRFSYKLTGPLNREIFEKSIDVLFQRHHTVFSVIKEINDEPYCDIVPSKVIIPFIDYSGLPENEKPGEIRKIIARDSSMAFNLETGPLYRLYIIKTADAEHYFHMSIHHIIFDGWSQGVFVNDLSRIYNGLLYGKEIDLEKLEFQQYDYAQWEKDLGSKRNYNKSIAFWEDNLKGCSPLLNFPYDFQRRDQSSGRGGVESIRFSREISKKLSQISKIKDAPLFTTMLSVFGIQMHKYSGDDDINIGLPVIHRPHSKLENIFGMFVDTVVVRLRYEPGVTFGNIINHTNESVQNAIAHQDLPFEEVVKIVNPERSSSANPLFQVAFVWQNNIRVPIKMAGIKSEKIEIKERAPIFDIILYLWENEGIIEGEIEYNLDILKTETIIRLKKHLLALVNSLIANIDLPVISLPMISDEERKMIASVNDTYADYSKEKTIIQLFEEKVFIDPGRIAVVFDNYEITYKDLNLKADQLAVILQNNNIRQGDFIGLLIRRSPELIICLLAIFKIGAAYVPLNLTDPENRINSILDTADIKYIITHTDIELILKGNRERLNIEQLMEKASESKVVDLNVIQNSSDPAYIIFTSGTTGTPKGVFVDHKSVINLIEWVNNTFKVSCKDKLLWTTNLSFDLSVYDIFGMLAAGGIIRIVSEEDRLDPKRQYDIMLNEGITFWDSAPQSLQQLTPFFNTQSERSLYDSLRLVFLSGDWIPLSLPGSVTSIFPSSVVVGLGGATEATVWSNYFIIDDINPEWKSIPYGKPIQNARYYILDNNLEHCRVQQPGNLYIGGECLALGYFKDPVLTDSKFVKDPFNPGSRLYLTGDKAQWMADGNIEFLGREDEQVKIRGYRVELGEIKDAVLHNTAIKDAVVLADKSDRHDMKAILFYTTYNEEEIDVRDLKKELRICLPEYMIPTDTIHYVKFPLTANSKIDTKTLLSDYFKSLTDKDIIKKLDRSEQDQQDLTPTQRVIHKIWCETLKVNDISVVDSFFDIGGNSLLGIRLMNQIREEYGISLTFRELITNSTIDQLGFLIDGKTKSSETIKLVHLTATDPLPLTSNQKRLWLISQVQPDIPTYIIPLTYKLLGFLNRELFEKSLGILFERHHIVFSVIREERGEPYCEIIPRNVKVSYKDYTGVAIEERKEKVMAILNEDSRQAFDLDRGPLYRLYLIRTDEEEYYFHMSIHHIIFDGWSHGILVNDLSKIYNSLIRGEEAELESLEFQEYDYAQWEANKEIKKESVAFWEENLKGCSPVLNFPYDYQRSEKSTGIGGFESIRLSKALSDDLRRISKEERTSLFATMMGAFGVVLHKYTGEDDLNIGLPVAYRPHSKLEHVLGMFVNTVVVRLNYEKGDTFRDLIRRSSDATQNAIAHQDVPFEKVVEIIKPERIPNTNPLFQVAFEWQNDLSVPLELEGIRGELVKGDAGAANFDITLALWEKGDYIEGELHYSVDIFKHDSIVRLKEIYVHLLESLSGEPDKIISEFSLVSENDKRKLEEFNNTEVSVPDFLVQELFEDQALFHATKTAVISGDSSLTYKDLDEKSNQMARHLISLGVNGGDVVGICIERSVEMVVSVLGVLKAGCCYLPLDPLFPGDRIAYMYEDSGAKVLISQKSLKEKFHKFPNTSIVLIDAHRSKLSKYSTDKPEISISNRSLAYMIYTSGSTGKPKGVKVHHEAVVNFLGSMKRKPGISQEDKLLAVTTLSFDISVLELFLPLSTGAGLIVTDTNDIIDGQRLSDLLERHEVTIMQATPATWNILIGSGWKGKQDLKALCGGEAILPGLVRDLLPRVESLWDMYGPTETTVWSTCKQLTDAEPPILIGIPIDNTQIYILDKYNNEVPVGVIGEVCIGGLGVTKGYHNRPDLTAEKFIEFGEAGIIYKTGDLGRHLSDGNIELFGRMDNQLKLRGFRIEPGEIESLLSQLSGVKEAVVTLHKFEEHDERLVAFLNVEASFSQPVEEIKNLLSQSLPSYMIPSFFQTSDGFPRLPNGKINKKALIYEIRESDQRHEIDFDLLTATQKKLLIIWGQILKIQNISIIDKFFDIGGNSLLGIRIINQINEKFGITLTFRELVINSTIDQLGLLIDSKSERSEIINLVHLTETTKLPLTRNQKRIWLLSKLQPDVPLYIIRSTYKFNGSLNREIFERSLDILFQRHHIVFSVIREANKEPYCDIVPTKVAISFIDLIGLPEEEKSGKVTEIINDISCKGFDLERGPLYGLYLIKTAENEYFFHMSIHHIIFDGWSQGVFARDLSTIYYGLIRGEETELDLLEYQIYDYAHWEDNSEINQESIAFWKEYLNGCSPVLNFPYDFQRKEQNTGRGGLERVIFTKSITDDLRKIGRKENTSLFATVISAFGVLLNKYSGEDDINIGLPVAYRPHSKLEHVFGMFVNTVVVRLKFEKGITYRELIKQTNDTTMNAISHQDLTFERLVEIVKPERISNTNPLFQVAFTWQNDLSVPLNLEGVKSTVLIGDERAATFDITLALWENGDFIEGVIEYNMDILKPETITRLKGHFMTLVINLIKNIDVSVSSISMISEEEKIKINDLNKTATNYPKDRTISQLFEEKAGVLPDHIAISFKGESYTYKQLNEKANQLARTLRKSGVRENIPVGILSDKSLEMIVGILGILKAGGCYTPIDSEYPEQRVEFMIKDSGIKVLLTQDKYFGIATKGIQKLNLNSEESYNADRSNLQCINHPEDFAYILYTSGTTGVPKGTPVPQRGVVRLVCNTNYNDFTPEDKIILVGAIVFDATTLEIWSALLNGGSLYIVDRATILNAEAMEREISFNGITNLIISSAYFTHLVESRITVFSRLKFLMVGGDVLSPDHANRVRKFNPDLMLINGYGPTENSCMSTYFKVERDYIHNIPIGKPNSNSTVYIFDKDFNYQPVGVPGELYVGGDGLSTGYLNRDELNKRSFIEHPDKPGERLYRTGDMAKWLPDWNIEFLGRTDNQLKIRGYRIELEEIESIISEVDGVIETVIRPVKLVEGDYRLVAFLNISETHNIETSKIVSELKTKLPGYMLPSTFKFMHGFPRTVNGKIDRKALHVDLDELEKPKTKDVKDLSPTERIIHKIWCEVLKTDDVSLTDSFFEIGGNSLLAISVMSKIESAFNIKMELRVFFDSPRIKDLAEFIDITALKIFENKPLDNKVRTDTNIINGEI